jgi:hypothetical protein
MKLTVRHYHPFKDASMLPDGKLDSPEAWDALRAQDPHFSVPESREAWLRVSEGVERRDGQDGRLIERAGVVAETLRSHKITSLISIGAGAAGLEYQVQKRLPNLRVVVTEYAPETVQRLAHVFTEAEEVRAFDLVKDSWSIVTARADEDTSVVLMYRLDAGFTDGEWREIFTRLHSEGVKQVLYIPTGFLTVKGFLLRLVARVRGALSGRKFSFAGYLRTRDTFRSYWADLYGEEESEFAGTPGFWLSVRG